MKPPAEAMERLRRIVGPKGWTTDEDAMAPHLVDWRGNFRGRAKILLKPASTDEVRRIVRCAAEYRMPLVPQGGNTGLAGGATPDSSGDEILVSLVRLNRIRAVDPLNYSMTADAGVTLAQAQQAAADIDRLFALSIGAEGSATIGGAVSTNAGGVNVLRYGTMRDLVLGLEVVLPSGEVWNGLSALRKDNTGYDLKQLFIGAEGTLGIVTAATLKLFPAPRQTATALAAVPDPQAAVALLALARATSGDGISSFELMPGICLALVKKHIPALVDPLSKPHDWYVLIDLASPSADEPLRDRLEDLLTKGVEQGLVIDGVIPASSAQTANLWHIRHAISEAEKKEGVSIKHDISVPVDRIPAFIAEASKACEAAIPGVRVVAFGHIGDGNVHFNLSAPSDADPDAFKARWGEMNDLVHDIVARHHGSISAEHGIGVLKRAALRRVKPPLDLQLMQRLKAAIDPDGIMNPGKIL
ncbi:MAG: FAD-binding oxidoreductase [Alphaproteobacteria bacterium]|nr:MAG: FAD-binding oxidoreductase [Alphaproteobacteria bacterium]